MLFLQKNAKFRALGAPPPHPRAFGGWGLCPQTPKSDPPIANFWLWGLGESCKLLQRDQGQSPGSLSFFDVCQG